MDLKLAGKVVIVTGAARGLGAAIAEAFAAEGARLALLDVNAAALDETVQALAARTVVHGLRADVSDEGAVNRAVQEVLDAYGRIDVLVNNAGIASATLIPDVTVAEWDRVMAINLRSVLLMSQAILPIMQRQRGGVIINMASMAGKVGGLRIGPAYAASKAGIICLTLTLARNSAPYGVRVNALAPAFIESAMTPAERSGDYLPLIPIGRLGQPEDVAAATIFLASERASFITGEVLDINGGALMD